MEKRFLNWFESSQNRYLYGIATSIIMVDLLNLVPFSVAGIVALLVNTVISFIALVIADKLIAHNVDAKRLFIMALVALFLTPIVGALLLSSLSLPSVVSGYVFPFIVWLVLGELLIKEADMKTKLKVVVVAFVVWIILSMFLAPVIYQALPL